MSADPRGVVDGGNPTAVQGDHITSVCGLGRGEGCCAFLVVSSSFACAKGSGMEATIRARLAAGSFTAKGDNCSGPPDFGAPRG